MNRPARAFEQAREIEHQAITQPQIELGEPAPSRLDCENGRGAAWVGPQTRLVRRWALVGPARGLGLPEVEEAYQEVCRRVCG